MLAAQVVHFPAQGVDDDLVDTVGSWGYETHAADVPDGDVDRVLGLGVARLTTDNPGLAVERRMALCG